MREEVRRDRWGIPYLRAPDVMSLARLQGRVTATDRAWQLELARWRMEGRSAEHLGGAGLAWDVLARQVRLEATARAAFEGLDAETRAWCEAYVEGVGVGLAAGAARSPELARLGVGPADLRPWQPWTPLGIFWVAHLLFANLGSKLFGALVQQRLGPRAWPVLGVEGQPSGSNAVGIAGRHTVSGLPLVAGDPHRSIELPGVYAQVGLRCPELDVTGFAFPGVPGVQHFAHAGSVAWAITNAVGDYQDLYLEELQPADPGPDGPRVRVRESHGWSLHRVEHETVLVRGAEPVGVPVLVTDRGPVVTGLVDLPGRDRAASPEPGSPTCSLRTPSQVTSDLGFGAFLPLLRSRDVDDVERALQAWVEPVNSVVVADTAGRVRHLLAGRVPRRDPLLHRGPGLAWEPDHAWRPGWAERAVRPVLDHVVSANDRGSGGGLGADYAPPHRARRLNRLITDHVRSGRPIGPAEAAALSLDTRQGGLDVARPFLAAAAVDGAAAALRDRLLGWDGHTPPTGTTASAWADWRHHLVRWLAGHPALAPLHRPTGLSPLLGPWLDPVVRVGQAWESLLHRGDELGIDVAEGVRAALRRAAEEDPVPWGERHRLVPLHGLGEPGLEPVPVAGDTGCLLAAGSTPGVGDAVGKGPVARYVWDLADRSRSGWVVPFGADGAPTSPHHHDQQRLWLAGELVPVATDWDALTPDPAPRL